MNPDDPINSTVPPDSAAPAHPLDYTAWPTLEEFKAKMPGADPKAIGEAFLTALAPFMTAAGEAMIRSSQHLKQEHEMKYPPPPVHHRARVFRKYSDSELVIAVGRDNAAILQGIANRVPDVLQLFTQN